MSPSSPPSNELQREHLELLLKANALLSSSLSIDQILELLMDQVIEALRAERGFVLLYDEKLEEWGLKTARFIDQATVQAEEFQVSRGVIERVRHEGCAVFTSDAQRDDRFSSHASIAMHRLRSILCAPIFLEGQVRGVIYTDNRMKAGVFSGPAKELLVAIANQAGRALENASLYERLQRIHQESMKAARLELAETNAQLVQSSKLAAVGQLAAGLAHEVNNPLGALALNIGALRKKMEDPVGLRRLELMKDAVGRCQDIIGRLLHFSQPKALAKRPVRLDAVLRETLQLIEPGLKQDGIAIRFKLDKVTVAGDADQLGQVFLNLVLNAHHALKGRPNPCLDVACRAKEGTVAVSVTDNGCGMGQDVSERVFEPFFTTKDVGQGVGLGLAVSYRILQEHGGAVKLTSQMGKGTRFIVTLPAARDES